MTDLITQNSLSRADRREMERIQKREMVLHLDRIVLSREKIIYNIRKIEGMESHIKELQKANMVDMERSLELMQQAYEKY